MKKICNKCFIEKTAKHFFKDKSHSTGLYSICKECKTESTMVWREKNKEYYNQSMRDYNQREGRDVWRRNYEYKKKYGITLIQYNELLQKQNNACAICKKTKAGTRRKHFVVDHNHSTGNVRGLLCYGCNRALHTLDNFQLLAAATEYIKTP